MNSNEMTSIDLPSLLSIQFGNSALWGRDDDSSSIMMRSNNEMIQNNRM